MDSTTRKVIDGLGLYFYKLAENSQDVFWVRSKDFQSQLYISPAFELIWKHDRSSLYKNPSLWITSIVEADRVRVIRNWQQWFANPEVGDEYTMEYRILDRQKHKHWIKDTIFPIFNCGEFVGIAGISADITQDKHGSKQIDYLTRHLPAFIESNNHVFWIRDLDGNHKYLNHAAEKMWGKPYEELYTNPESWLNSIHPDDKEHQSPEYKKKLLETDNQHQSFTDRYRVIDSNQKIKWVQDFSTPIYGHSGQPIGFAGLTQDVTAHTLRERELSKAKKIAEQANRSKSDFLAMISHELRTPLNAILGMAQILNHSSLSDNQRDQLDVIVASGKSLLSSLSDLLDYAKIEVGNIEFNLAQIDLYLSLEECLSSFRSEHIENKPINLTFNYSSAAPRLLFADEQRLRQILNNLLTNALKFTSSGEIKVKVSCLQKNRKDAVICITVEDSGSGVQRQELNQIFQQYSEQKSVYVRQQDGLGLGLVIVRELVERMGGSLAVSSEPGYGSQFSCIIPFSLTKTEKMPSQLNTINPAAAKQDAKQFDIDVLVVEDNPINQKITKIMLEQVGCRVDIADCGQLAIQKMNNEYDMVFMDIGLPDIDGFETTTQIRSNQNGHSRTPIVAMTAHVFNQDRERCFQVGIDEVIAKPILREDLIAILQRWTQPSTE